MSDQQPVRVRVAELAGWQHQLPPDHASKHIEPAKLMRLLEALTHGRVAEAQIERPVPSVIEATGSLDDDEYGLQHELHARCHRCKSRLGWLVRWPEGTEGYWPGRWEIFKRTRIRERADRRQFEGMHHEELVGTPRGGRRRRAKPRGVQWECHRGCRLPSMSFSEVSRAAEAEWAAGRRELYI